MNFRVSGLIFSCCMVVSFLSGAFFAEEPDRNWLASVQDNIRKSEYNISRQPADPIEGAEAEYQAPNRAQGFRSYFSGKGVRLIPREKLEKSWTWGLEFSNPGGKEPEINVSDNRIEYDRGDVIEWFINEEKGLEHGFTVYKQESSGESNESSETLNIEMKLTGSLHPKFSEDGQAIEFYDNGNVAVLRYSQLKVNDSTGALLPSRFVGIPGGVRIEVDDSNAVYPVTVDPILTTPSWIGYEQSLSGFGSDVSTAGDVNGDGYSDVLVGAYYFDNGETDEGAVYLYLGSASGLSSSYAWFVEGNQAESYFGGSIATAGDVNGDGYSDVIVGASSYDSGESDEGRAYVYHGGPSGLSSSPSWTDEGDQIGAHFGVSVATAGDVNGDGYSDVIVGANEYDNGELNEGMVFVYYGSSMGLSISPNQYLESDQVGGSLGVSVSTAGDVNADGYSDVIIGSFSFGDSAWLFLGSASGLASTPASIVDPGLDWSFFGYSVSTAGDVNGDGYADVIVGAWNASASWGGNGQAFLYYGGATGISTPPAWIGEVDKAGEYGRSVATAGDVNGDGYADVIVGSIEYTHPEQYEGGAFLYLGSADGLPTTPSWISESNQEDNCWYAASVSTAGDVNGDGYSDIIVGSELNFNPSGGYGAAFVFHGGPSGPSETAGWSAEGDQIDACFGVSAASAGDVNADGYSDVIVGAYLYDNGESDEGKVFLYLGSSSGLSVSHSWTAESNQEAAHFGVSVSTAGDVNGDGFSDVIVGANAFDNGESDEGKVFLYLGSPSGLSTSPSWTAEGDQEYARLGISASTAGDVNGDGYSDVIVGAYLYDNGESDEGKVFLYLGSSSGLSVSHSWTAESNQEAAQFGSSVSTAGDVNGDGYSDVIVGACLYDNGESDEGMVFLYLGGSSGLSHNPAWTDEGDQENSTFGLSVATAGDVNGDGYSDVLVGMPNEGIGNGGATFLYLGGVSGLSSMASWTGYGDNIGAMYFGKSVATAGDLNGDGYSDVIIGAPGTYNGEVFEGSAFIYLGGPSGLSTNHSWSVESNLAYAYLGASVSMAGDVNGDGYSDLILGANEYSNGQTDEGAAYLYYGNGGPGVPLKPMQRRTDDSANICHLGMSDSQTAFRLAAVGITPYGRGKVKLEYEVKPLGTLFNGSGLDASSSWMDTGTIGVALNELVGALNNNTNYHWRMRLLYNPVTTPFQQKSRWFTIPVNGSQEKDLKTFQSADISVSLNDSPDPICQAGTLTYTATIYNGGPSAADGVVFTDTISSDYLNPAAVPSQGSCQIVGTTITCNLGTIANGSNATVTITGHPSASGTIGNSATVSWGGNDPDPGDNSDSETTEVTPGTEVGVTNVDSPDPVCQNDTLTYTVTVSNNGTETATGVQFVDSLEASYINPLAVPSQGSCQIAGTTVTCDLGTIAGGSSATITITGQPSVVGSLGNFGMVTINECDSDLFNDNVTISTEVLSGTISAPASPSVTDIDACAVSSVTVTWDAVAGASGYDLLVGSTEILDVTSPYIHEPGDSTMRFYAVRAKNACVTGSWSGNTPGTDSNWSPGEVTIDSITDNDPCTTGITITFSGGLPSASFSLLKDGIEVETGISSPHSFNPIDLDSHNYTVRSYYNSCHTDSAPWIFADIYDAPSMPSIDSFEDVDGCLQNGIKIYFTGGTPSTRHALFVGFTEVMSDVTSPVTYDPGDTNVHPYQIRTYNNTCWNEPMPQGYADEAWPSPTQPSITGIADADPCQMSGISVSYSEGAPADRHALYMDGSEQAPAMTGSPYLFLAPDTLQHTYTVRAYNNSCFISSTGVSGTDADNTTVPVITGPNENTCPVKTVTLTTQSGMSDYQWYLFGSPVVGATTDTLVINEGEDGNYTVSFTNGGCFGISAEHMVTVWWCPAAPAPAPDGSGGTQPVSVSKLQPDGSQLRLTWDSASCPASDYNLIWGNLTELSTYMLQGGECLLGADGSHDWPTAAPGDIYILIVGYESNIESNWGTDSNGDPRNGLNPSNICDAWSRENSTTCP